MVLNDSDNENANNNTTLSGVNSSDSVKEYDNTSSSVPMPFATVGVAASPGLGALAHAPAPAPAPSHGRAHVSNSVVSPLVGLGARPPQGRVPATAALVDAWWLSQADQTEAAAGAALAQQEAAADKRAAKSADARAREVKAAVSRDGVGGKTERDLVTESLENKA